MGLKEPEQLHQTPQHSTGSSFPIHGRVIDPRPSVAHGLPSVVSAGADDRRCRGGGQGVCAIPHAPCPGGHLALHEWSMHARLGHRKVSGQPIPASVPLPAPTGGRGAGRRNSFLGRGINQARQANTHRRLCMEPEHDGVPPVPVGDEGSPWREQ